MGNLRKTEKTHSVCPSRYVFVRGAMHIDQEPISIGERRELFIDDYLIDSMDRVELLMHEPERKNVAITCDRPWEGTRVGYVGVIKDDNIFRMYYTAGSYDTRPPLFISYAESEDGVTFARPNLGLFEVEATRENNVVLPEILGRPGAHDLSPFLDTNPDATPEAKYKAVGARHYCTLCAFKSPDGIHWSMMDSKPLKLPGFFDTQNIAFWSEHEQQYVLYYRVVGDDEGNMYSCAMYEDMPSAESRRDVWQEDTNLKRLAVLTNSGPEENRTYPRLDPATGLPVHYRHVARAVSDDFINWKREGLIRFPWGGGPSQEGHYYTNCIRPYYRAPHITIGFPGRFTDRGVTPSTYQLPQPELRRKRPERRATAVTDSVLIHSRDGTNFYQHDNVFLRPGPRTKYNWCYHDNFIAWHPVETPPTEDDSFPEMSLYASEGCWSGLTWLRVRRHALRIDGFVSARARTEQGELVTKPFTFEGGRLSLNLATSGFGWVKVELLDAEGGPLEGRTLEDADIIYGDSLDRTVSWQGERHVGNLTGRPIRMRFLMRETDLYSFKFEREA